MAIYPSKFQWVSRLAFVSRYCTDVAQRRSTKLCMMFGRLLGWYTIYTFSAAFAPNGILPGATFTLRPSLAFSYIGSVTAQHYSSGRRPNCFVVQGMELRNFRRERHLYSAGRPSRWASVAFSPIQPIGHNRHGLKARGCAHFRGESFDPI